MRAEAPGDASFLFHLFSNAGARAVSALPLPKAQRDQLLDMQFRAMRQGYRQSYPDARFEIVSLDNDPIGNIVTDITPERALYVDIAILPAMQGKGIATALMRMLLEEPAALGIPAEVSVMGHNDPSLALCRRLGFTLHAERPPYLILRWNAQPRDGTCT